MNEPIVPHGTPNLMEAFYRERKQIFSLSPEKALNAIFESDRTGPLIRSFPEEDLYVLIKDIGPEDCLQLLSLASKSQWEYFLDMEAWQKDSIDLNRTTRWFNLLIKADPSRFIQWFFEDKTEFVEYFLFKTLDLKTREHDQDPSDFGEDYFTEDDVFYLRFLEVPVSPESGSGTRADREEFLSDFLSRLSTYDHVKYQQVMLEFTTIIPAECEEESFRLRNVRLAEKGFLPFHEAMAVYRPLRPADFKKEPAKVMASGKDPGGLMPVPFYPVDGLKEKTLFTDSLALIRADDVMQQVQTEFAGLCNQIISADQKEITGQAALRDIVKKACGYLSIGLERLTGCPPDDVQGIPKASGFIRKYPLSKIFRTGYGAAVELKWQLDRWLEVCWFLEKDLPLSFWDENWTGILGGLLLKKPLFYDNYRSGSLYREFNCLADIKETQSALDQITALDRMFALIPSELEAVSGKFITFKNLTLTLWARGHLNLGGKLAPLAVKDLRRFFNSIFEPSRDGAQNRARQVKVSMKESFLAWLSGETGLKQLEIVQAIGPSLEALFDEVEGEFGGVSNKNLDPAFIHLFLIR
ncbi:MAG: DUF6178 family protein [Desulfobacterales bacterium]|nr:DUF6178 family protein [Desulfobacterales bacterium]